MMYFRTLGTALNRACRTFPAILVTGPRQSGKTTLLRACFEHSHRYLSLENPDVRSRALGDPVGFLRDNRPPIIFDEVQYAPELLPYIKTAIDEQRTPGAWIMTGSQSFPLMAGVSESLAGRVAILELLPFSAPEAARFAGGELTLDDLLTVAFDHQAPATAAPCELGDWLLRGAYPEPRANPGVDRDLWCASYIQTYLERDVRQLINVGDLNTFERFLRLAAGRTGQILNHSDLARDTGVSPPTARQWLSVLEASGLVYLLPPYFKNFGKRMIKSSKLYFLDTGLATFLMGLHSTDAILHGPTAGALVETAVMASWVKAFRHRGLPPSLYYWRSRDGLEVDLVIERNNRLYPIEVKAAATLTARHATSLVRFGDLAGQPQAPAVLVANVQAPFSLAPNVRVIPWWTI